jgi:hypothetical protein
VGIRESQEALQSDAEASRSLTRFLGVCERIWQVELLAVTARRTPEDVWGKLRRR